MSRPLSQPSMPTRPLSSYQIQQPQIQQSINNIHNI